MTRVRRAWLQWLHILSHREPATALAVLRIILGLIVVHELGRPIVQDLVPLLWLVEEDGGYRLANGDAGWRFAILGGYSRSAVWGMLYTGIGAGLATAIGAGGRLAPFVALQCFVGITDLNLSAGGSDDYLVANALWLIVLADSTSTGSIIARWKTGRFWPNPPVPAWPRYLVVFQLVAMYFSTGLQKMSSHWVPWGDLSALYYIVQQPTWQRLPVDPVGWYPVTQAMTLAVWCWEISSPVVLLALWWRFTAERPGALRRRANQLDLRSGFLAFGVGMHAGIFLTMEVGMFSVASVACYVCAFHPDELASAAGWVHRRLRRDPSPSQTPA